MSFLIVMPIAPNNPVYTYVSFKTAYLDQTTADGNRENAPSKPLTNTQQTHYIFESFRLTQNGADALTGVFPMVQIRKDFLPVGQVIYVHPENRDN